MRNFYQPFLRVCTYHFKFYMSAMLSSASKWKGIWDKPHQSRPQQTSLLYPINPSGFVTIWHRQAIRAKWTLAFGLTCETKTFLGNFRIFLLLVRDITIAVYQEMKRNKKMPRYLNQTFIFALYRNTARWTVFPIDFERLSFCWIMINYHILIRSLMTEIQAENKYLLLLRTETFFGKEILFSKFTIF